MTNNWCADCQHAKGTGCSRNVCGTVRWILRSQGVKLPDTPVSQYFPEPIREERKEVSA